MKMAVMTVPASFNRLQRQELKDAGAVAGLNVLRFISSGTAASIAYGFDKKLEDGQHNVLVFDLGGGALNVSLVCIELDFYEVKASAADVTLGGQVFDNLLVEYCVNEFERVHGNGIRTDSCAMARLRLACEHVKKALSFSMEAFIELDALHDGHSFYKVITRVTLESLCGALFEKALQLVQNTLRDGTVKKGKLHEVVVVGGSARIPKILQLLKDFFVDKAPSSPNLSDDSAAFGVTAHAAVLSGAPSPKLEEFMLLDVVPLSFWAEIDGVGASTVVYRNSTLPMKRMTNFSTSEDNQSVMHIRIFEGERCVMSNNHLVGTIEVDNIPLKPRGEAEVAVAVDVDAGGVVNVSVTEKSTGLEKKLLFDWGGLPSSEIERMREKINSCTEAHEASRINAMTALENCANSVCSFADERLTELKRSVDEMQAVRDNAADTLRWLADNHWAEKAVLDAKRQKLEDAKQDFNGDAATAA